MTPTPTCRWPRVITHNAGRNTEKPVSVMQREPSSVID